MTQIFGIHCINGLPNAYPTKNLYDISLMDNNLSQIGTDYRSSIYIASDPAGAQIFIDSIEQTGFLTPSMITDVPPGHHNFRLTSPGYIDIESSIPLESGRTYNLFLTMGKTLPTSTDSSGIIILLALGLGFLLIRNK
jgi:hypothetical protein